jgi:hypothetical protein
MKKYRLRAPTYLLVRALILWFTIYSIDAYACHKVGVPKGAHNDWTMDGSQANGKRRIYFIAHFSRFDFSAGVPPRQPRMP